MTKTRLILLGGLAAIILLLVVGRIVRQGRADALRDSYSGVVSVSGFVLKPEPFTRQIEETGVLTGNKESIIAAETGGRVVEVMVDMGDVVQKGQPLVRLDDELYRLESERAKIAFDKAKMDLERMEKLFAEKSVSETDIESVRLMAKGAEVQYRMALRTYNDATLRAPFSGTVAAKMTEVGQMVERGMPVLQLVDISALKLTVSVSETEIGDLAVGSEATVVVEAVHDTTQGRVIAIGSRATTGSRTFPVEIQLAGDDKMRSGMFARAILQARSVSQALLLPRAALLPDVGQTVVFLAKGKQAQKVVVRPVGTVGDRVAVEGLAAGDTVITVGNQALAHGMEIQLTLEER
jgi:membrane fusion protein (multidrug efflux system)